jgi:hypothetical protein
MPARVGMAMIVILARAPCPRMPSLQVSGGRMRQWPRRLRIESSRTGSLGVSVSRTPTAA